MNTAPHPHSADAPHPLQIAAWRAMGAARRSELAAALRRQARGWKRSALRAQHPAWPEAQIDRELARIYRRGNT
ncbi:MAG: hypothetical protein JNK23_00470 [Opitutaceae bacterium]|nr:hypothetical protein [Opitutaceae bacterium]